MRYTTEKWKSPNHTRTPSDRQIKYSKEVGKNKYTTVRGVTPSTFDLWVTSFHLGSKGEDPIPEEPNIIEIPYNFESLLILTNGLLPEIPSQLQIFQDDNSLANVVANCINDLVDINNKVHSDIYMDPENFKKLNQKFNAAYKTLDAFFSEENFHSLLQDTCKNLRDYFKSGSVREYFNNHEKPPEEIKKV